MDPSIPIDMYFKRIDDAIEYADDGDVPFTGEQILQTAYHAVSVCGLYKDACKEWRAKPQVNKTWQAFKVFFAQEYHELREQQRLTAGQSDYRSTDGVANMLVDDPQEGVDMADILDNLENAVTNDHTVVAQLVQDNATLTNNNKALADNNTLLTSQIKQVLEAVNNLTTAVNMAATKTPSFQIKWDPEGYCWTHGFRVTMAHNSKNFTAKATGHKDDATRSDTKKRIAEEQKLEGNLTNWARHSIQ